LVGGDFNLSRYPSNKSNGRINKKFAHYFNDWVNRWGLIEINPSNRRSNNQKNRVHAKLDRVFMSTDWEATFSLARVVALYKGISDHAPLLVDVGDNMSLGKKKFRYEKLWLERPYLREVVKKAWAAHCPMSEAIDIWQFRLRTFRGLVRGWGANVIA
jgi:hypothetical protein